MGAGGQVRVLRASYQKQTLNVAACLLSSYFPLLSCHQPQGTHARTNMAIRRQEESPADLAMVIRHHRLT